MNKQDLSYERSEDLLFRRVMERVAVLEGEKLLRETDALNSNPAAAVPADAQKRCLRAIRSVFSRQRHQAPARTVRKILRAALLAAVIALLLGAVAFATIPSFHARVLQVFMKHEETTVDWDFENVEPGTNAEITFTIPPGYHRIRRTANDMSEYQEYIRGNDEETTISILIIYIDEGTRISTDAEDLDSYEEITVCGDWDGILTQKHGFRNIAWVDADHACYISIAANALTREDMIDLAESIKFT